MGLSTEDIQKKIDEQRLSLEELTQYRDLIPGSPTASIADLIEDADWEGDEVSLGFEQGFLAGMKYLLELSKE